MTHEKKVARISAALKSENLGEGPLALEKQAVSHFVPNPNDPRRKSPKLNVRDLNQILSIDPIAKIAIAEPGVTFETLVRETMKFGLIPMLVPELRTITVGGAVSGCSVESLSYKYGGFHDTCLEYEVISGIGEVLICSPEKNSEIFHMMHGSYGTLGILAKLTFRLMPAKPFVRMEYLTYPCFETLIAAIKSHIKKDNVEFMDAIVHAPNRAVLCLGTMVDRAPFVSTYTTLKMFYKSTTERAIDYLTLEEYLFRYDTECHWMTRNLPGMSSKIGRFLFGRFLLSSTKLLTWSKRLAPILKLDKRPDVVVDVFIPSNRVLDFYQRYTEQINYYPLWVVPYATPTPYPWIDEKFAKQMNDTLFFDLAVYGLRNRKKNRNYYKIIEDLVMAHKGFKTLISHNFYDREAFWTIYNRERIGKIKARMDPRKRFRDLYEKFHF